jgi:hypothetical protein
LQICDFKHDLVAAHPMGLVEDTHEEARRLAMSSKDLAALAADADGQTLLRAAGLQRRAAGLSVLRRVIAEASAISAAPARRWLDSLKQSA